jgi:hypothetical protein
MVFSPLPKISRLIPSPKSMVSSSENHYPSGIGIADTDTHPKKTKISSLLLNTEIPLNFHYLLPILHPLSNTIHQPRDCNASSAPDEAFCRGRGAPTSCSYDEAHSLTSSLSGDTPPTIPPRYCSKHQSQYPPPGRSLYG